MNVPFPMQHEQPRHTTALVKHDHFPAAPSHAQPVHSTYPYMNAHAGPEKHPCCHRQPSPPILVINSPNTKKKGAGGFSKRKEKQKKRVGNFASSSGRKAEERDDFLERNSAKSWGQGELFLGWPSEGVRGEQSGLACFFVWLGESDKRGERVAILKRRK